MIDDILVHVPTERLVRPVVDASVSLAAGFGGLSEQSSSLSRILRRPARDCRGVPEVHQEIAAALISPALADGLKVKAGTTALEVQRTYKLATGKIAQVAINTHPASRFRHSMTMRRAKG